MGVQLPTPAPSPPPERPTPTLSAQINAATRKQHVILNRLIVDRLALALPPHVSNPTLLGHGLAAFAQIYFTFEDAWEEILDGIESLDKVRDIHGAQIRQWLAMLRPDGLARSSRLAKDLEHISHRTRTNFHTFTSAWKETFQRTEDEIRAKPHIVVAYSWVMYMAIFSGGRWIRHQLADAGPDFWMDERYDALPEKREREADGAGSSLGPPGFSFLSFDGDQDGEDIKNHFKARLTEADTILTQQEQQDVIDAAQQLFEDCIALAGVLDNAVWSKMIYSKLPVVACTAFSVLCLMWLYWYSGLRT